jgi:fibronectin type 3 domain-containing protein
MYEYAVQAFDIFGGKSGLSNIIQLSVAPESPLAPAGIRATAQTKGILVEWDDVSGLEVTGYRVYRYERGKQPVRIANLKLVENEFTDTKARKGQLYFYFITSMTRSNIESEPSPEVSARR